MSIIYFTYFILQNLSIDLFRKTCDFVLLFGQFHYFIVSDIKEILMSHTLRARITNWIDSRIPTLWTYPFRTLPAYLAFVRIRCRNRLSNCILLSLTISLHCKDERSNCSLFAIVKVPFRKVSRRIANQQQVTITVKEPLICP